MGINELEHEMLLDKIKKNDDLISEIFEYDPRILEQTSGAVISKYTIGLAQYVIYLGSQINKKKVLLMQKKRLIELAVLRSDIPTKTKGEKLRKVVDADEALGIIESSIADLEQQLTLFDGSISYFTELINAFKRELTRRDKELEYARYERRP